MKYLILLFLSGYLILFATGFAQEKNTFYTKYTTIYYQQEQDLKEFIKKLSGKEDINPFYIDRIIDRVESILNIQVKDFNIKIYLKQGELDIDKIAYFDNKTNSINISIDNISDGVFAHEVVHALLYKYFTKLPSSKIQEIIAQYVDINLWKDY